MTAVMRFLIFRKAPPGGAPTHLDRLRLLLRPALLCAAQLCAALLALGAYGAASAMAEGEPAREADRITRASALEAGHGAVILSVRSEIYLIAPLDVYFVREGGDIADPADVVRFSRSEGAFSLGNSTTKYKVRSYQLPAGRWRLAGHGVKCPKVPEPDERCLVDVKFAGIGETISFPSRGYGEDAPVIEVREGALTLAGDFALTARNTIEWSSIPPAQLEREARRFVDLPRGPEPQVGESFRLEYPLRPRSLSDDRGRRY